MAFQIPNREKRFIQTNRGDFLGNLFTTFNMDFDSELGKVRVSPRLRVNTDSGDDPQLGVPTAFLRTSVSGTDQWWALCGTVLFKTAGTDPSAAFTQDALGSSPTTMTTVSSDLIEYNGKMYASLPTDIAELDTITWDVDWWTNVIGGTALTTAIPHPLLATIKTNTFLAGDGNLVHAINKNENVSNSRLILPSVYQIIWMKASRDGTWIGTRHTEGGEGQIFFWDEVAENYNRQYGVKHARCFAGIIKDGIPWTVNGAGQLLQYNGVGFEERAVFPVFSQSGSEWTNGQEINLPVVHRNGMSVVDEKIHILIDTTINNDLDFIMENFPPGVWIFDNDRGLTHKYPISRYDGTENDYGTWSNNIGSVGTIYPTNAQQGLLLVGARFSTDDGSTFLNAILFRDENDSIVKRGHFTTAVFESSAFEDVFQDILLSFKRFRSSGDRIIVKYRAIKNPDFPIITAGITWTDTDTFTTTKDLSNVTAGDEVYIIRGTGAGTLVHISSISEAAGTYTVNLDETIANATGTGRVIIDDFTKCATISTQSIERQGFDLDVVGTWIQLKVELRSASGSVRAGDSPELEKIVVKNIPEIIT